MTLQQQKPPSSVFLVAYVLGTNKASHEQHLEIANGIREGRLIGMTVFAYVHGGSTIRCGSRNPFSGVSNKTLPAATRTVAASTNRLVRRPCSVRYNRGRRNRLNGSRRTTSEFLRARRRKYRRVAHAVADTAYGLDR